MLPFEKELLMSDAGTIFLYPKFTSIKSTQHQQALLTSSNMVYLVQKSQKNQFECRPIKKMNHVQKLESSLSHFIVLRKEIVPPVKEWTPDDVSRFFTRIGFPEIADSALRQNIQGPTIAHFDEDYFKDNFGIDDEEDL